MNKHRNCKKKRAFWLPLLLCFFCALALLIPRDATSLSKLSRRFFFHLFQNDTAKEVFGLEEAEWVFVFGNETDSVFL